MIRRYLVAIHTAEGISLSLPMAASHGHAAIAQGEKVARDNELTPTASNAQLLSSAVTIAANNRKA